MDKLHYLEEMLETNKISSKSNSVAYAFYSLLLEEVMSLNTIDEIEDKLKNFKIGNLKQFITHQQEWPIQDVNWVIDDQIEKNEIQVFGYSPYPTNENPFIFFVLLSFNDKKELFITGKSENEIIYIPLNKKYNRKPCNIREGKWKEAFSIIDDYTLNPKRIASFSTEVRYQPPNYLLLKCELEPTSIEGPAHRPIEIKGSVPTRDLSSLENKNSSIYKIVTHLNPESTNRYKKTDEGTKCNVYAYDFCHLAGVYIPRVWWRNDLIFYEAGSNQSSYITQIMKNQSTIKTIDPYSGLSGINVQEVRANNLYRWLNVYGHHFGWKKVDSDTLQNKRDIILEKANQGNICIVIGRRLNSWELSGHISIVLPENESNKVSKDSLALVISQAGGTNYNATTSYNFWEDPSSKNLKNVEFYWHE